MTTRQPDSLGAFVDQLDPVEATLLVLNRTEPAPMLDLLLRAFHQQPVHVVDHEVPGAVENEVLLLDDGGFVASSPLSAVARSFLLVNADRFRTGPNALEAAAVPAVLRELTEIPFELRGYPESAKEKLLLIVLSRYIEARALDAGAGELRVGFQRLSRLDSENGTRRVYERLGASGVETHVYGVGNAGTASPDGVTAHEADTEPYRRSWFLTFEPPAGADADPAALVAREIGDNRWRGMWTFDPGTTERIATYVRAAC